MVDFDTDEEEKEIQISSKTREITTLFHHAENLLKRFSTLGGAKDEQAELVVRQNIQRSVGKRIQSLNASFQRSQQVKFQIRS
jgi:hypothetical protein